MYYTITQGRKPEPYKWIRRQRYRGKAGTRMEKLLKALAMLPGGTGAEAEIVDMECKHVWWGHTSVLVYSQPAIKELKITLDITFLMCIHTCARAWIPMYMEATSSDWVASSFLSMFSLVETGRLSLEEPGYHWLGSLGDTPISTSQHCNHMWPSDQEHLACTVTTSPTDTWNLDVTDSVAWEMLPSLHPSIVITYDS